MGWWSNRWNNVKDVGSWSLDQTGALTHYALNKAGFNDEYLSQKDSGIAEFAKTGQHMQDSFKNGKFVEAVASGIGTVHNQYVKAVAPDVGNAITAITPTSVLNLSPVEKLSNIGGEMLNGDPHRVEQLEAQGSLKGLGKGFSFMTAGMVDMTTAVSGWMVRKSTGEHYGWHGTALEEKMTHLTDKAVDGTFDLAGFKHLEPSSENEAGIQGSMEGAGVAGSFFLPGTSEVKFLGSSLTKVASLVPGVSKLGPAFKTAAAYIPWISREANATKAAAVAADVESLSNPSFLETVGNLGKKGLSSVFHATVKYGLPAAMIPLTANAATEKYKSDHWAGNQITSINQDASQYLSEHKVASTGNVNEDSKMAAHLAEDRAATLVQRLWIAKEPNKDPEIIKQEINARKYEPGYLDKKFRELKPATPTPALTNP